MREHVVLTFYVKRIAYGTLFAFERSKKNIPCVHALFNTHVYKVFLNIIIYIFYTFIYHVSFFYILTIIYYTNKIELIDYYYLVYKLE